MWEQFMNSIVIMGKGMLGIFTAILIIMIAVFIMGKISEKEEKKEKKSKN